MKNLEFFVSKKANLNPIKGGLAEAADAVTNSHGRITKSAGSFDADNKTSDSDTASSLTEPVLQP